MEERKEISKKGFRIMVYLIIIIGAAIMSVFTFLSKFLVQSNSYYIIYMGIGQLLLGFGVGLAYSRVFKIKDFD